MLHWHDVRYAFRLLRRAPLFTLLTLAVLAGGLGLSIFTFSFLHTAMLKPLPLSGGDRIVRVEQARADGSTTYLDAADFAAIRPSITTLDGAGAFTVYDVVVGDERHRRALRATATEPNIFELTRTRPIVGRVFNADDQIAGVEPVIVLSHRAWRVVFGADSAIVGRRIPMNGSFAKVIGVMPEGYGFPVAAEAWVPLAADVLASAVPGREGVSVYGRLAAGATAARATVELSQLIERARRGRPEVPGEIATPSAVVIRSFQMAQLDNDGPMVFAVLNLLATLILLLACINVINLLLARANERAKETAVRLALGASRGRLIMQSMWENIALCVVGGVLATGIAAWGLDTVNTWAHANLPSNLAFWWVWSIDRPALIAAGGFITATIAVLGGVVSARVASTRFVDVLREGGARAGGRREGRIARALVITQVATVTLLMFFGVMSSIVAYRVAHVDFGYDTHNLLNASVSPPAERFTTRDRRARFYQTLTDELNRRPSVAGVLLRSTIASIDDDGGRFAVGPGAPSLPSSAPHAYVQGLLGSLDVIGVRLNNGRDFDARDDENGASVAIVSRSLAAKYWPGRTPIGEQVRVSGVGSDTAGVTTRTIVGVVSDVQLGNPSSRNRSTDAIYVPLRQVDAERAAFVIKHRGDAAAAQGALYEAVAAIDPRMLPPDVQTFDEMLASVTLLAESITKLFALCFGFALLLAVSGTYGLMARSIGQRTREVGIRRALGATDRSVTRLLLGQGSRQLGIGVLIALPLMLGVGVGFASFFPVGIAASTAAGALVSASIVAVVLLATYVPTRRVLQITPRDALWRE